MNILKKLFVDIQKVPFVPFKDSESVSVSCHPRSFQVKHFEKNVKIRLERARLQIHHRKLT